MINLVPPEIKQRKGLKSLVYVVTLAYIVIASALVLGLAGLATYNYSQKIVLDGQQAELDRLAADKTKDKSLISQAAFVQDRVKNASTYKSSYDWNLVLDSIAQSTPTNTRLTSIKVTGDATKPPTIAISGESSDRRAIILFKDKLALTKPFNGAGITSLTESAAGTSKTYTFSINASVTKK
jgi:Tfp pilus assembly protein PilN